MDARTKLGIRTVSAFLNQVLGDENTDRQLAAEGAEAMLNDIAANDGRMAVDLHWYVTHYTHRTGEDAIDLVLRIDALATQE
jgi:hypothetical protein